MTCAAGAFLQNCDRGLRLQSLPVCAAGRAGFLRACTTSRSGPSDQDTMGDSQTAAPATAGCGNREDPLGLLLWSAASAFPGSRTGTACMDRRAAHDAHQSELHLPCSSDDGTAQCTWDSSCGPEPAARCGRLANRDRRGRLALPFWCAVLILAFPAGPTKQAQHRS